MANIRQVYVHTDRVSLHCEHGTNFFLHKGSSSPGGPRRTVQKMAKIKIPYVRTCTVVHIGNLHVHCLT